MTTSEWLEPKPSGYENAKEMPTGKHQHIPINLPDTSNYVVCTDRHVPRRFAMRTAVAEDQPIRPFAENLRPRQPFIIAIIPFEQIFIRFSYRPVARQFAGSGSAF